MLAPVSERFRLLDPLLLLTWAGRAGRPPSNHRKLSAPCSRELLAIIFTSLMSGLEGHSGGQGEEVTRQHLPGEHFGGFCFALGLDCKLLQGRASNPDTCHRADRRNSINL